MTLKKKVMIGLVAAFVSSGVYVYAQNETTINDANKELMTINGKKKTMQDLYNATEFNAGFAPGLEVLDTKVLTELYKDDSRLQKLIDENYKTQETKAKESNTTMEEQYALYGAKDKNDYIAKAGIKLSAMRKLAAIDQAAKDIFTKEQLQYVYDHKYSGTGEIFHILVAPDASGKDYGNTEVTDKKLAEALKKAQDIISEINSGKISFADAVKKYSNDKINENGSLGSYDVNSARSAGINNGIINEVFSLKNEKVSAKPVQTEQGYEIVMIKYSKEKPKYEDIENDVKENLYGIYEKNNPKIYNYALDLFRSANDITINDNTYSKEYANKVIENRVAYQQYDPNNPNNYLNY